MVSFGSCGTPYARICFGNKIIASMAIPYFIRPAGLVLYYCFEKRIDMTTVRYWAQRKRIRNKRETQSVQFLWSPRGRKSTWFKYNVVVNLSFFRGGAVFTKATHSDENQIKNQRPLWGYDYFAWWSTCISISRKDENILAFSKNKFLSSIPSSTS